MSVTKERCFAALFKLNKEEANDRAFQNRVNDIYCRLLIFADDNMTMNAILTGFLRGCHMLQRG